MHRPIPLSASSSVSLRRSLLQTGRIIGLHVGSTSETERQDEELESEAAAANKRLQQAEITLSSLKNQLKAKTDELKGRQSRRLTRSLLTLLHCL